MSSRTHVEILGVQIPLVGLAFVTSTPPSNLSRLYWSELDSAILKGCFNLNPPFAQLAERKVIPIDAGRTRPFFQYVDQSRRPEGFKPWE
jgi:hypothetical protein